MKNIYLVMILLFAVLGSTCLGTTKDEAKAAWILIAHTIGVEKNPTPEPTPTPDSSECRNCRGTGKVGDGTVMVDCPVCDGTGKITTSVVTDEGWPPKQIALTAPPRRNAELVVYTKSDCPPCEAMKLVYPELKKAGWVISEVKNHSGVTPHTEIWVRGEKTNVVGYSGREWFFRRLKAAVDKAR